MKYIVILLLALCVPAHAACLWSDPGAHRFTGMRSMHWGDGQQCLGDVDRSGWAPDRVERGLVFCERGHCIIIPTVCGNITQRGVEAAKDVKTAAQQSAPPQEPKD